MKINPKHGIIVVEWKERGNEIAEVIVHDLEHEKEAIRELALTLHVHKKAKVKSWRRAEA